ncbi:hypothetical protein TTHERM_000170479 (macronuclear) [Tetrahymena thermophila SB210]|uniref:Uncharacterized protein n=1 Tax=Tetrahymena thermophila (strain SB210) TaxID=312017 RepID=W7XEM2_TETTS|nr:hypothetical protein TTHERM_000170479 [Tetrahymena thermophila SB210]EWS76197.1 hypothetical protein TTHERM_000170479 [Tetrahymena thermophila SB210]|eukprot:XP_012651244.1 hypothetical protein TTHERM_000170479 [Tetrahymena thermophila SB210]
MDTCSVMQLSIITFKFLDTFLILKSSSKLRKENIRQNQFFPIQTKSYLIFFITLFLNKQKNCLSVAIYCFLTISLNFSKFFQNYILQIIDYKITEQIKLLLKQSKQQSLFKLIQAHEDGRLVISYKQEKHFSIPIFLIFSQVFFNSTLYPQNYRAMLKKLITSLLKSLICFFTISQSIYFYRNYFKFVLIQNLLLTQSTKHQSQYLFQQSSSLCEYSKLCSRKYYFINW